MSVTDGLFFLDSRRLGRRKLITIQTVDDDDDDDDDAEISVGMHAKRRRNQRD